jgi:hypothetical protein
MITAVPRMLALHSTESAFAQQDSALAAAVSSIIDELRPHYVHVLPPEVLAETVTQTVLDLSPSICIEALPEMASRLTTVRLDRRNDRRD